MDPGPLRRHLAASLRGLLDVLLPPVCPGCGNELFGRRWLCTVCRRALRPVGPRRFCLICRGERTGGREAGFRCLRPDHREARAAAGFWMEPPLDALVHALKYRGREDLARPLARLFAVKLGCPGGDALVPMPLHRTRRRERGYNQSELLALEISRSWGIPPVAGMLARRRATRAQARLAPDDRSGNVSGAFAVPVPGWVLGRHLVLIDDVITTGATALAAAAALRGAGAARVSIRGLALA